jgi:DNA-binding Lrp family transcriptional regulator
MMLLPYIITTITVFIYSSRELAKIVIILLFENKYQNILIPQNNQLRRAMTVGVESGNIKPVTAIVDIFVDTMRIEEVTRELCMIDAVLEVYEVTGEFDIATVVSSKSIEEFRDILKNKIMKIPGVKSVVSSIVLSAAKGPRANPPSLENRER